MSRPLSLKYCRVTGTHSRSYFKSMRDYTKMIH